MYEKYWKSCRENAPWSCVWSVLHICTYFKSINFTLIFLDHWLCVHTVRRKDPLPDQYTPLYFWLFLYLFLFYIASFFNEYTAVTVFLKDTFSRQAIMEPGGIYIAVFKFTNLDEKFRHTCTVLVTECSAIVIYYTLKSVPLELYQLSLALGLACLLSNL